MSPRESTATESAEIVVIGGGHNGLICAAYLAQAGLDVCVVEQGATCGGALFSSDHEGVRLEHGGVDHSSIVNSAIPQELDLERHGLTYLHRTASAVHMFGDGTRIAIAETAEDTARSIATIDEADADAWLELAHEAGRLLAFSAEFLNGRPVPMKWALRAGRVALGRKGSSLLELAAIPVTDLAETRFRSPHMRALAVARSQFSGLPPWYPGTGAVFCLTPAGHGRRFSRPKGGSRAFVTALETAVTAHGGRIMNGAAVTSVRRRADGWTVDLATGDELTATRAVVSSLPPQDFVLGLMAGEPSIPSRLRRRFQNIEIISGNLSQYTLSCVLSQAPDLGPLAGTGFEGSQLWLLADPADALAGPEAAAVGSVAARPGALVTFPSIMDPTMAPDGRASMWINGFVAREVARAGGWPAEAPSAIEKIWSTVDACLPGVREVVTHSVLTTPSDLTERTSAVSAGSHVAVTVEQLLGGRPVQGCGDHRLAEGLYLTGAGTNPGPGISGLPGRRCAHAILDDLAGDAAVRRWRRDLSAEWQRLTNLVAMTRTIRRG